MMNKTLLSFALILSLQTLSAQNDMSAMLINILKHQLKEMKEDQPKVVEDEVMEKAPSFIPPNGKFNGDSVISIYLDSIRKNIQVESGGSYIFETESGELRLHYLEISNNWTFIPIWQDMVVLPAVSSVLDSKGQENILPKKKYEEYMEQGYFSQENFGTMPGENESKVYLAKDPMDAFPPFKLKGELWYSFPSEYSAFTFTKADTGKTLQMDKHKVTLLSMDKNTVVYKVLGPRSFNDEFKKLYTNKNGKPFMSRHGSSLGYEFYMEAKKNNFELSDARLTELAGKMEKEAYSGGDLEQLYIEKVSGTFSKITFYKVVATQERTVPLELKLEQ